MDEVRTLENSPATTFEYTGGNNSRVKSKSSFKKASAIIAIIALLTIGGFVAFFAAGNIIPDAISTLLTEATDVQCADGALSKAAVVNKARQDGTLSEDAADVLIKDNVYTCADYHYDEAATKVLSEYGTNLNNFTATSDFNSVMNEALKSGSDISITSTTKTTKEDNTIEYLTTPTATSNNLTAEALINTVRENTPATSATEAGLGVASKLNAADAAVKERRSGTFFLYMMENISKMKAGDGSESKINDVMNFLTTSATTEAVDVKTGELVKSTGTPLESPSLSAILSGEKFSLDDTINYSSDRVLLTTKNQLGNENLDATSSLKETIASFSSKIKGFITSFLKGGATTVESAVVAPLIPTISSSLINNNFTDTIKGITAGEMLVEGATNVGAKLAINGSGASPSDSASALAYQKLNSEIIAREAKAASTSLSPFDLSSRYTFFGSIFYQILPVFTNFGATHFSNLLPSVFAEDSSTYLSNFGTCDRLASIGAVGSDKCSTIATFDTSTATDPFNDPTFIDFMNQNTHLDDAGNRIINQGSALAKYILFNDERESPLGITDANILIALKENSGTLSFLTDFLSSAELLETATDEERAIATGAAFTNSTSNPHWSEYKYAQRYVALARATAALKQFSPENSVALSHLQFFEGSENPVVAFTNSYYEAHPKDNSLAGYLARITGSTKKEALASLTNYLSYYK